jgi:hypothetical protein
VAEKLKLQEVFGIATRVNAASYVNRGGLDERLRYLLGADRHIAIHGDSKQGKSWLRSHILDREETIVVQCQVDSTPELLFQQALGVLGIHAELTTTKSNTLQGSLDLTANVELGKIIAKAKGEVSAGGELERTTQLEPGIVINRRTLGSASACSARPRSTSPISPSKASCRRKLLRTQPDRRAVHRRVRSGRPALAGEARAVPRTSASRRNLVR